MRLVIPAAGSGIRFAGADNPLPKLLIPIAGRPIISHILRLASSVGQFSEIIIILGPFFDDVVQTIRELASGIRWETDTEIICVANPSFETTNNIYSLYLARQYLEGNLIIHNSDVLVAPALFTRLFSLGDSLNAWILADNAAPIPETETKFVADTSGKIVQFGEHISSEIAHGRYIGATRFDANTSHLFRREVSSLVERGEVSCWYTRAMAKLADLGMLHASWSDGQPWCEIDTIEDYARMGSRAKAIASQIVGLGAGKPAKVSCIC
jgi:choline kinase